MFSSLYFSPKARIQSKTPFNSFPFSVKEYSTLGGTTGYTFLEIIPSLSKSLKFSVNTFAEIPTTLLVNSLYLFVPVSKSLNINIFHLFAIIDAVYSTGQFV